ncbi:hypothetical protein [Holdemanella porci]|uniref:hypothetical protein n=1 Tax=Holdemanella porci TaxID=2652276 RepID=UPI003F91B78D
MKKSKKGNSRKFNFTFLLAGIVIILIAILAILLGFNHLNKSNDTNHDRIVEQSKNKNKNQDEVSKSSKKPKLIDNTTLQKTIDSASSIDRDYYTDDSLEVLDQAIANAQAVIQNGGNQQEINDANMALINSIISLENK